MKQNSGNNAAGARADPGPRRPPPARPSTTRAPQARLARVTTVTLHDFVFLLSRHAAGVEALSRHPQSQLLAAIVGLFHEIESCSSTEGSVDWAGMQTQLMHAAKSVTTASTTADCSEYSLAPLLVHERGADVHVDAAAAAAVRRAQAAAKAHAEGDARRRPSTLSAS